MSTDMSVSLTEERDRIQRQVEKLEQILSVTNTDLQLLSSDTGTCLPFCLSALFRTGHILLTLFMAPHVKCDSYVVE